MISQNLLNLVFFNFLSQKFFRYLVVFITLPLIFYTSVYSRGGNDYKKTETYALMKFAEILEEKKFPDASIHFENFF